MTGMDQKIMQIWQTLTTYVFSQSKDKEEKPKKLNDGKTIDITALLTVDDEKGRARLRFKIEEKA